MDATGICLILLLLVCICYLVSRVRALYRSGTGLLVVFENRLLYLCRFTADDFLGSINRHILSSKGQVFLADHDVIHRLRTRELRTRLSGEEWTLVEGQLRFFEKICLIRNHELACQAMKRLVWEDDMRGNWPRFP